MRFEEITIRVLVRKNYGECFDFYTEKMGLVATWGDRKGPYTSFATSKDAKPCFAMFLGEDMTTFQGYQRPHASEPSDTIVAVIPTSDLEGDYLRLKEKGIVFLGEPQWIEGWQMHCTYFRDPEGNLFELNDATTV